MSKKLSEQAKRMTSEVRTKVRDMSGKVSIKTDQDLAALDQQVYEELGVELHKYRNPEIAGTVADLILFPKYVLQWVLQPVALALLLYLVGFFIFDYTLLTFILYLLVGLLLFIVTGLLAGIAYLITQLRNDLVRIVSFSFEIMEDALNDMKVVRHRVTWENRGRVMKLLFKGIIYVVTIPTLTGAIGRKIPIVGGLVKRLLKWALTKLAGLIKFEFADKAKTATQAEAVPQNKLLPYLQSVRKAVEKVNGWVSTLINLLRFPFLVGFMLSSLLLGLFLYILW